jgi:methyl-accepting chemotaxis protein
MVHVLAIQFSLWVARFELQQFKAPTEFQEKFDNISQALSEDKLIGHAWNEYAKTCVREKTVYATVRPQSFINPNIAREQLFGLKLMPTIPSYFVGLGLLLTFIGLVIALSKAAGDTAAASPADMTKSLRELLDAATFKFSTSVAGLLASLALSFLFRTYTISIEKAFDRFCRELEKRIIYLAPQYITLRSLRAQQEQLQELKQINDVQFFDRLGNVMAPAVSKAVERAIEPLTSKLDFAVERLEQTSRSGAEGLVDRFSEAIQGSAGKEIRELSIVLSQTIEALQGVHNRLSGSGEDFSSRMAEAIENFAKMASASSAQFETTNQAGKETINHVVSILQETAAATKTHLTDAAAESAASIRSGFADVVTQFRTDIESMAGALRSSETAFARIAAEVSTAAQPMTEVSNRIAGATQTMSASLTLAADSISASHAAARSLAERLEDHLRQIQAVWENYERQFNSVDEALAKTVHSLAEETTRQQENIARFVRDIDDGCTTAVNKLQVIASSLGENVEEIADRFEELLVKVRQPEPA